MKSFLDQDFLLRSRVARALYHEWARFMPIFDYHCHLPPQDIAEDRRFANMTRLWLEGDHYKWRALRTNGVAERWITGEASDEEKFMAWARTVPATVRNPLYHWTHMELLNPFGVSEILNEESGARIYQHCNGLLQQDRFSVRGLLRHFKVKVVCTTDDPGDDLEHHRRIRASGFEVRVLPTFRPDKGMAVEDPALFNTWVDRLGMAAGLEIRDYDSYLQALDRRHQFFHDAGCRLSDHGLEEPYAEEGTEAEVRSAFARIRGGKPLEAGETRKFKSALLHEFALMDHRRGWTQQLHFGALRNNNTRMLKRLGPDTGFDSIGDFEMARPLARFLNRLDREDRLPRTILYNLNPRDNELFATLIGNFQGGEVPGKLQYGSGWWFLDQKQGMIAQMNALSNMGLLSRFVGMLTDSRSFLSYSRHEYFRRILCNLLGADVENGELPEDMALLGNMVQDICFRNAARYFAIAL